MPPSVADWLQEDHLAFFVLDTVDQMDLGAFYAKYRAHGSGAPAHDPKMMVALLVYAHCLGLRSSRQIERACHVDIAFRVVAANQTPDHTTVARFRQHHEEALNVVFSASLRLCAQATGWASGLAGEGVDPLDLLGVEQEIEGRDVLREVRPMSGLRDGYDTVRKVPREYDLARRGLVRRRHLEERWVFEVGPLQWPVALEHDTSPHELSCATRIVEEGAPRDLIHRRGDAGRRDNLVDLACAVVAHADRAHHALGGRLEKDLPGLRACLAVRWPVDKPKVDVVGTELGEALLERLALAASPVFWALRREEDLPSRETAVAQGLADLALVRVGRGCVEMAVAEREREPYDLLGPPARQLPGAKAEKGHLHPIS